MVPQYTTSPLGGTATNTKGSSPIRRGHRQPQLVTTPHKVNWINS
uniref:Uncharacterized protein n=1 Tax=Anguilla anguilla TaxID=7936 RepID=A0A0E9T8N4_ANGAN